MNIYKVSRTDGYYYDEYSDFICYAEDEEQAVNLDPFGNSDNLFFDFDDKKLKSGYYFGWVTTRDHLTVTKIGFSESGEVGIILASYHAG